MSIKLMNDFTDHITICCIKTDTKPEPAVPTINKG